MALMTATQSLGVAFFSSKNLLSLSDILRLGTAEKEIYSATFMKLTLSNSFEGIAFPTISSSWPNNYSN